MTTGKKSQNKWISFSESQHAGLLVTSVSGETHPIEGGDVVLGRRLLQTANDTIVQIGI